MPNPVRGAVTNSERLRQFGPPSELTFVAHGYGGRSSRRYRGQADPRRPWAACPVCKSRWPPLMRRAWQGKGVSPRCGASGRIPAVLDRRTTPASRLLRPSDWDIGDIRRRAAESVCRTQPRRAVGPLSASWRAAGQGGCACSGPESSSGWRTTDAYRQRYFDLLVTSRSAPGVRRSGRRAVAGVASLG